MSDAPVFTTATFSLEAKHPGSAAHTTRYEVSRSGFGSYEVRFDVLEPNPFLEAYEKAESALPYLPQNAAKRARRRRSKKYRALASQIFSARHRWTVWQRTNDRFVMPTQERRRTLLEALEVRT